MKIVEITYERTVSENYQSRKFGMKAIPEDGEHPDVCAKFLMDRVHTHLGLSVESAPVGHLSTVERPAKLYAAKADLQSLRERKSDEKAISETAKQETSTKTTAESSKESAEVKSSDSNKGTEASKKQSKASGKKDHGVEGKAPDSEVKSEDASKTEQKVEDNRSASTPSTGAVEAAVAETPAVEEKKPEAPVAEEKAGKKVNPALCYNRELLAHKKEFSRLMGTVIADWQSNAALVPKVQELSRKLAGQQMFEKDGVPHKDFIGMLEQFKKEQGL